MAHTIVSESEPIGIQMRIGKKIALEGMMMNEGYFMDRLGEYKMNATKYVDFRDEQMKYVWPK